MKKIFAIFMLMIVMFSLFTITVEAKEKTYWCNCCQENHKGEFSNSVNQFAWEMHDAIYGGNIFDNTTNEVLKLNMTNSGLTDRDTPFDAKLQASFEKMWSALKTPYTTLAQIGKILLVIFVLMQAMEQTSIRNIGPEDLLKMFIKCAIGVIVIDNGYQILTYIVDLGSAMFDSVYDTPLKSASGSSACIFDKALKYGFVEAIASIFTNVLPWIIIQVAKVVVFIAAWSRILEIGARTALAPIGMADIITEGLHGNGMRYFRKYLACAMQGSIIVAAVKVYGAACNMLTLDLIPHCALACVLIVIMFRSQEFANQIAGV